MSAPSIPSVLPPPRRNRLSGATSPYLLQHATNPVDWHPWGPEALEHASRLQLPIFLSIGYSACHWCHVMAHESFEDPVIAELLNRAFVPIKVDREERPDIDAVYMAATLAMNEGHGGWPMTVFLTPALEPFFAATYVPPEDRWGRPGLRTLLTRIADLWAGPRDRETLVRQAQRVTAFLRERDPPRGADAVALEPSSLARALDQLAADFDPRYGGFGSAPKFPPSTAIALLLRLWRRLGSEPAREMARVTLAGMARGGLHDQIGGGFHRYSTDERWLVPHFEKMLYDNALLARAYLEGWQATGEPLFRETAERTLDYVLREMTDPAGGFYSATDADSEGQEGRFFVWTPAEVRAVVCDEGEARRVCAYYDVTETGNWEGRSIPNRLDPPDVVSWRVGEPFDVIERAALARRERLLQARQRRTPPGLDDKVLTAWNGLMIGALAEGALVLGEPRFAAAARRAADFVLQSLSAPSGLLRCYRAGRAHTPAFLEDHAFLAEGLLDLYEAGAPRRYLDEALVLVERVVASFGAESGAFYGTAHEAETLLIRTHEGHDGATPSANATAAFVLIRLSFHLGRLDLRERGRRALEAYGAEIEGQPRAFAKALMALELLDAGPIELVVVGPPGDTGAAALFREIGRHFVPRRLIQHSPVPALPSEQPLPLLAGKTPLGGQATLYVCRRGACHPPTTRPEEVAALLEWATA